MKLSRVISLITMLIIMVCSVVPTSVDAVTLSRQYIKYVVATGETSTYTLSLSSTDTNARALIGTSDERVSRTRNENTGIVKLVRITTNADGSTTENGIGTGFIVGDHMIATAGHCVYNPDITNFMIDSTCKIRTYNANGTKADVLLTPKEVHVSSVYKQYADNEWSTTSYDYALITVSEDLSGYAHFNPSYADSNDPGDFRANCIYVSGIPSTLNTGLTNQYDNEEGKIYTHYGNFRAETNDAQIHYTIDATGGQSGAPVYMIEEYSYGTNTYYEYSVIGIHSGGRSYDENNPAQNYNMGPAMNYYLLHFYGNNPHALY